MLQRYSRSEMVALWEPENRYKIWLEIETLASEKMAELGLIPKEVPAVVRAKAGFDPSRIDEIEQITHHDVIAFLTNVAEYVGPEARFLHQGMTSSDVLDTCFAKQLTEAADILLDDLDDLLAALKKRAYEHKNTPMIGRSHGIHAEPISFGLKLATFYAEFDRNRSRLRYARSEIATCKISGAVGTFAHLPPEVEDYVAQRMGLVPEPVSTQVIPRDRHAFFFATLAVIASSLERLGTEIRSLQRTEVAEVEEYFNPGQKGSSAMPHKRNPVLSENLCGLARMVRSAVTPALENVALWHERDISHSSVERMIGPDSTITLDFALVRAVRLIEKLVVYPERMAKNLAKEGGLVHSQQVLLLLTKKGVSRDDAYRMVQKNAMQTWSQPQENKDGLFRQCLSNDPEIMAILNESDLDQLFDIEQHSRYIDLIFKRVFDES